MKSKASVRRSGQGALEVAQELRGSALYLVTVVELTEATLGFDSAVIGRPRSRDCQP